MGRAAELTALAEELGSATAGAPRVVLLTGPAGSGKSSLLRHFVRTHAQEAEVVTAGGEEAEALLPLGLLDQLVRRLGGQGCSTADEPLAAGAGLLALVDRGPAGGRAPLVVLVDDAQWADAASLQALAFAARRLYADAVLLVVAGRDDGDGRLAGVERLAEQRGRHLALAGLTVEEVAEFGRGAIGRPLPRPLAERLREHTGGVPLTLTTLVAELGDRLLVDPVDPLPAPRSYAMLVLRRLAACADATQRLVMAAAVLGVRSEPALAAAVAGLDDALPAIGEAAGAGLVELGPPEAARRLVFRHPLVRAAVYHDLPPDRRCALHGRAARLTSGTVALEHRVSAAVGTDAALAGGLVDQARIERGRGAVAAGGVLLLQAARLHPDAGTAHRLALDGVTALLAAGEVGRAAEQAPVVRALPYQPRRDLVLGQLAMLSGQQDDAARMLTRAAATAVADGDRSTAATAALVLGQLRMLQADADEAAAAAARALSDAGPDLALADEAEALHVMALGASGRTAEGLARVETLGPACDVGASSSAANRLLARGIVRLWSDDLAGASGDLGALAAGERPLRLRLTALGCLAKTEYRLGAWDDSLAHSSLGAALAADAEHAWTLAFLHAVASLVPACRGDDDRAAGHVARSRDAARLLGAETDQAYAAWAGAHVAWARGDAAGVLAAVAPVLRRPSGAAFAEPSVTPWRELYADALVSSGRLADAEHEVASLEALARRRGRRSTLAGALVVRGRLDSVRGRDDAAVGAFTEAVELLEDVRMPFAVALAQAGYGAHLRRRGRRREALERLSAAQETFEALGAVPFAHRLGRELEGCGGNRAVRRGLPVALTPQEVAVTRLVREGRTNRQIAEELVVSVKTVEYHLGHVFAKLGVRTRTELAARLASGDR